MPPAWLLSQWHAEQNSGSNGPSNPSPGSSTAPSSPPAPGASTPASRPSSSRTKTARKTTVYYKDAQGNIRRKVVYRDAQGKITKTEEDPRAYSSVAKAKAAGAIKTAENKIKTKITALKTNAENKLKTRLASYKTSAEQQISSRIQETKAGLPRIPTTWEQLKGQIMKIGSMDYTITSVTPQEEYGGAIAKATARTPTGLTTTRYLKPSEKGSFLDVTGAIVTQKWYENRQEGIKWMAISYSPKKGKRVTRGKTQEEAAQAMATLYSPGKMEVIPLDGPGEGITLKKNITTGAYEEPVPRQEKIKIKIMGENGQWKSDYEDIVPPEEQAYYYYHPEALKQKYDVETNAENWQDYVRFQSSGDAAVQALKHLDIAGGISAVSQAETIKAKLGPAGQVITGIQKGAVYTAESTVIGPAGVGLNIAGSLGISMAEETSKGKSIPEAAGTIGAGIADYITSNPIEFAATILTPVAASKILGTRTTITSTRRIGKAKVTTGQTTTLNPYKEVTHTAYNIRQAHASGALKATGSTTTIKGSGTTSTGSYTYYSKPVPVYESKWWGSLGKTVRQKLGKPSSYAKTEITGEYAYAYHEETPYARTYYQANTKIFTATKGKTILTKTTSSGIEKTMPPTPIKETSQAWAPYKGHPGAYTAIKLPAAKETTIAKTPAGTTAYSDWWGEHPTAGITHLKSISTTLKNPKTLFPENLMKQQELKIKLLPEKYGVITEPRKWTKPTEPFSFSQKTIKQQSSSLWQKTGKGMIQETKEVETQKTVFYPEVLNFAEKLKTPSSISISRTSMTPAFTTVTISMPTLTPAARQQNPRLITTQKTLQTFKPEKIRGLFQPPKTENTVKTKAENLVGTQAKLLTGPSQATGLATAILPAQKTTATIQLEDLFQPTKQEKALKTAPVEQQETVFTWSEPSAPSIGTYRKRMPILFPPFLPSLGGRARKSRSFFTVKPKRKPEYTPSLSSVELGITTTKKPSRTKVWKGNEIRPVVVPKKASKKQGGKTNRKKHKKTKKSWKNPWI